MKDNQATATVIQFPGNKKPVEKKPQHNPPPPAPNPPPTPKTAALKVIGGATLAVALFTGAVNHYAFDKSMQSLDLASSSSQGRAIASVEKVEWQRDAAWERSLAESLASTQLRTPASASVGHDASVEEKLRWGTLEEKYTIVFKRDVHRIDSITLQDATTSPTYILDRSKFLKDYGSLMEDGFTSAQLNSVEVSHDKTVESYLLYDKEKKPKAEARFELDTHKRLLSLKVAPSQI